MQDNQLSISSVTGVDIQLEIAGPGSRSFAFVIDWHIRFILAVAWFVFALLIINGSLTFADADERPGLYAWLVFIPTAAIYFLYHPFVEVVMRGRTPGKRIAGVRVVTRDGDSPGVGALLIRNIFRIVDSQPLFYVIGLVTTFVTAQHVRIGDLAAGTLLVVDHDQGGQALARLNKPRNTQLDPKLADLVDEVLERWIALQPDKRREIAIGLLLRLDSTQSASAFNDLRDESLRKRLAQHLEARDAQ